MPCALNQVGPAHGDDAQAERMAEEIRAGLTARPRWLPSKYFYDDRGSRLFDDITRLPEYYQTRTEQRLLADIAGDVVARVRPVELVELGSGAGRKTRHAARAMMATGLLERCVLLDINASFLARCPAHALAAEFPGLAVQGVVADFLDDLELLGRGRRPARRLLRQHDRQHAPRRGAAVPRQDARHTSRPATGSWWGGPREGRGRASRPRTTTPPA